MPDPGEALGELAPDEVLIRFVPRVYYIESPPDGCHVAVGNLTREQFSPPASPSMFRASARTIAELEAANPRWKAQAVVTVTVRELEDLGLSVRLSPEDCEKFPSIRDAHVSIVGVTAANRQRVIDLFGRRVRRPPPE
jgi:hypothetical protein